MDTFLYNNNVFNNSFILEKINATLYQADLLFPMTLQRLHFNDFENLWIVDESQNPTGTHKDRIGLAVLQYYRDELLSDHNHRNTYHLPHASLISSGSAAIAIQSCLQSHSLPDLKVLVDKNIDPDIVAELKSINCEVYTADLSEKALTSEEILKITENEEGVDLTSNWQTPLFSKVYNGLSIELKKLDPDFIFVPFGTGQLYNNIFLHLKASKSQIIGVTTTNPNSRATKLFASFRPFSYPSEGEDALRCSKTTTDPSFVLMAKDSFYENRQLFTGIYELNEEILSFAEELIKHHGLEVEPSGAAGLALFLKFHALLSRTCKIIIISTGKASALSSSFWEAISSGKLRRIDRPQASQVGPY